MCSAYQPVHVSRVAQHAVWIGRAFIATGAWQLFAAGGSSKCSVLVGQLCLLREAILLQQGALPCWPSHLSSLGLRPRAGMQAVQGCAALEVSLGLPQ